MSIFIFEGRATLASLALLTLAPLGCTADAGALDESTAASEDDLLVTRPPAPFPPFNRISAPFNVTRTASLNRCMDHTPGMFGHYICRTNLTNDALMLTWDWWNTCTGAGCLAPPDHYKIYMSVNGAGYTLVKTIEANATAVAVPKPGSDVRTCYAVRAVNGTTTSANSAAWCTTGFTPNVLSKRVDAYRGNPTRLPTFHEYNFYRPGGVVGPIKPSGMSGDIFVGFGNAYANPDLAPKAWEWDWWRGGAWFPVDDSDFAEAVSATLRFHANTYIKEWSATQNCATNIEIAKESPFDYPWSALAGVDNLSNGFPKSTPYVSAPDTSNEVAVDVTSAFRSWRNGSTTNYGFMFRGPVEAESTDSNSECLSGLSDIRLQVDYFDTSNF
jgi:hypothetical protein